MEVGEKRAGQQPLLHPGAGGDKEIEMERVLWASSREMFIVTYKDAGGGEVQTKVQEPSGAPRYLSDNVNKLAGVELLNGCHVDYHQLVVETDQIVLMSPHVCVFVCVWCSWEGRGHRALRFILSLKDFLLGVGPGPEPGAGLRKPRSPGASLASSCCSGGWGWPGGGTSRTPSGAFFRLCTPAPPALFRWSCWMMAENLASRDGLPVLERGVGRETQFSFSWYGGGGGRREAAGGGGAGLLGQVGGAYGWPSDGGGGARRFLLLLGAEVLTGLEEGVEVLLSDRRFFCTTSGREPSNRVAQ